MTGSGYCRLCGGPLPPRKPGAGRPRSKCDACRDLRRPQVEPNWDSDLVRAVQRDYPDDSDPFVYMAWLAAAYLAGRRIRRMLYLCLRSCGGRWLIWTLEGNREAIRMVLMSFVCGRSTAGLCGEWLPLYSADGF